MEPTDLCSERGNTNRSLRSAFQRVKNFLAGKFLHNPVQPKDVGRLDADKQQLHAGPSNLQGSNQKPDSVVPAGVRRSDYAGNDEYMPRSVWANGVVQSLADYIRHVREVDQQSDKPDVPYKPDQPSQRHVCERNPHRSCDCPRHTCADDSESYRNARGPYLAVDEPRTYIRAPEPNELGNFNCPVNNKLCSADVCRGWCRGG